MRPRRWSRNAAASVGHVGPPPQLWLVDGVVAGAVAWPLSELPSALDHRHCGRPWWSTDAAAATLLFPASRPVGERRLAGTALRILVALNWGAVLSRWLDRRHPVSHGAGAGLALGLFEYGLVGRRRPLIRALPAVPQLVDQVVFGAAVGAVLARLRRGRPS